MIDPQSWSTDPKKNIKPIDLHAPTSPQVAFSPKDLYPDAEIVSSLAALTQQILRGELAEEENWLRKSSIPLIDEGYRVGELVYIIRTDRFWHAGRPIRGLLPSKDVHPLILMARRKWRKWFPYRLPNGKMFDRIAHEELPLK